MSETLNPTPGPFRTKGADGRDDSDLRRLAGGVAHDFNNLIMSIMGHSDICRDALPAAHALQSHLEAILNTANRATVLTRQLLAFARKQIVTPKILNLNDCVAGLLDPLRPLLGDEIRLVWRPGDSLWSVRFDPGQFEQMLADLCVNARDSGHDLSKLTLETANATLTPAYCADHLGCVPGEYVQLTVSDDGKGIPKDKLAHLFEPSFATEGRGAGIGLGLATVYGIVQQNHGFIDVCSEDGKGTTFCICLPRVENEVKPTCAEPSPAATPTRGQIVLLTEDDEALRETCGLYLNALGYMTLVAKTPEAAITLATRHPIAIHLLLTDVVMPGMDGPQLAQQLCAVKPGLKVLYMSGFSADVIAQHGISVDEVQFIQKPFSRDALARKVREVLDSPPTAP